VLSARNRTHQRFLGVRERAQREPHLLKHGSAFVFYALLDAVVDRYFPVMDALEIDL
jgi:magnesium transporter